LLLTSESIVSRPPTQAVTTIIPCSGRVRAAFGGERAWHELDSGIEADTIPDPLALEPLEDCIAAHPDADAELLGTVGRGAALRRLVAGLLPTASPPTP
jgi:hypothetical protein